MARQLFELITDHLDINEAEYFGIYILLKNDQRKWLRLDKEIKKQLKGKISKKKFLKTSKIITN